MGVCAGPLEPAASAQVRQDHGGDAGGARTFQEERRGLHMSEIGVHGTHVQTRCGMRWPEESDYMETRVSTPAPWLEEHGAWVPWPNLLGWKLMPCALEVVGTHPQTGEERVDMVRFRLHPPGHGVGGAGRKECLKASVKTNVCVKSVSSSLK